MSKPFDATLKGLGSAFPRDLLVTFDPAAAAEPVQQLNVDLSTVTAAADLVVGVGQPLAEVVHIDFQSSADADKHLDVLAYNVLLFRTYRVPVHSIVVLLRRSAGHPNVNGAVRYSARPGRGRVEGLTAVARRIVERLEAEATAEQTKDLVAAAFILTGLRVPRDVGRQVFLGVRAMRDSDTFLAILEEGQEKQARRDVRRLAEIKFGPGEAAALARLEAISDLERLERLLLRIFDATSWQDLLDTP